MVNHFPSKQVYKNKELNCLANYLSHKCIGLKKEEETERNGRQSLKTAPVFEKAM